MNSLNNLRKPLFSIFGVVTCLLLTSCASSPRYHKTQSESIAAQQICKNVLRAAQKKGIRDFRFIVLRNSGEIYCETTQGNLDPDTPIPVLSASKWVSAAVIQNIVADNKIKFSSTIADYFPTLKDSKERSSIANTTLAELLRFQSGLEPFHPCFNEKSISLKECAEKILWETKMIAGAGKRFDYGPVHFVLAGALAEKATDSSWQELFEEYMKAPLALAGSALFYTKPKRLSGLKNPRLDGGLRISYEDYLEFLRAIVDRRIAFTSEQESVDYEGIEIGRSRFFADGYTNYRYGFGVWLECEDSKCHDKAISSPGLFGVYPLLHRERGFHALFWTYHQDGGINSVLPIVRALKKDLYSAFPLPADSSETRQ